MLTWPVFALAWLLDYLLGDPAPGHPVRQLGRLIAWMERLLWRPALPQRQQAAGILLVIMVVLAVYLGTALLVALAYQLGTLPGVLLSAWLLASTFSARSLARAGRGIKRALEQGKIEKARAELGMVVGRDTGLLLPAEVARGTVETVAENTVDAVVAPLFFALIGGVPLAMAYRAVNTLDSMLGYRNDRYLYFGWAAARLDDLANYLPARLTALLLVVLARVYGGNAPGAWKAIKTGARLHPSPNAGWPEAAVAGALGLRLGGWNSYGGIQSFRPYLGLGGREAGYRDIEAVVRMMYQASFVVWALVLLTIWRWGSALLEAVIF